jgi:nitric oxide reductase NorE protein
LDTKRPKKPLQGDLAIWFFIYMELIAFGIFFVTYAFNRHRNVELFNSYQQTLDTTSGMINTLLLITGSYFVVRAVEAIHQDQIQKTVAWLERAMLMGILFLVTKSYELWVKIEQGISLDTNIFYLFYLSLTGFHFLHVVLGLIILFAVWIKTKRGCYSSKSPYGVESGAAYWHMVDLVWIILFPLVYVIR